MATKVLDARARQHAAAGAIGRTVDRWIYVFMALLYFVTVLVGFVPDSVALLPLIRTGESPPLTPIWHLHAVAMGSWMLLFLAQTIFMATGRKELHKKLGVAAVALVPLMIATMIGMTFTTWRWAYANLPAPALAEFKPIVSNILIEQIHAVVVFPLFVGWALLVRRSDPESHKRFLVQAILPAFTAATDRIGWLPTTVPGSYASSYGYALLWLSPVLINDLVQRRRLHSAYVIGLAVMLLFFVVNHLLWNSAWWLATAPKLMGVAQPQ